MMSKNNEKKRLSLLKQETCSILEKNNAACARISEINDILNHSKNSSLEQEKNKLETLARDYFQKIQQNYENIVNLEKMVNGRVINPNSPSMKAILYETEKNRSSSFRKS